MTTFDLIAEERVGLADMLTTLTPDQWGTQSLCDAWTVHDVAAHLLMPLVTPIPLFMVEMVRNRMDFNQANVSLTAKVSKRGNEEIIAQLRQKAHSRFTPPRLGPEAPLTDCLVHGQDIRRPLGIPEEFSEDRLAIVLGFLTGGASRGFVPASRTTELRFEPVDIDWRSGDGPVVSGTAEAIMMAVAGRKVALPELSGPGAEALAERLDAG